jgi:hypothetical protein
MASFSHSRADRPEPGLSVRSTAFPRRSLMMPVMY